jgi:hypothetical protein
MHLEHSETHVDQSTLSEIGTALVGQCQLSVDNVVSETDVLFLDKLGIESMVKQRSFSCIASWVITDTDTDDRYGTSPTNFSWATL